MPARKAKGEAARTHYTVAEVESWRDGMYTSHRQEAADVKAQAYQQGLIDGTDKLRADIRDILCIKEGS